MFDTHCHLNFEAFNTTLDITVKQAQEAGVVFITVPSTDITTSQKAIKVADTYEQVYAAIGIHPHHVFELKSQNEKLEGDLKKLEELLATKKVVAVGEVGMDRHYYVNTKYSEYEIDNEFMVLQGEVFRRQVALAVKHSKSLILHNREAKGEFLNELLSVWDSTLKGRTVFHCCEPDRDLLAFAKEHGLFIGVDGDLTYSKQKQSFITEVPLEMLVLETDAPFLIPEPFRSQPRETRSPNVPANIKLIAQKVAMLKGLSNEQVVQTTTLNAKKLFGLMTS